MSSRASAASPSRTPATPSPKAFPVRYHCERRRFRPFRFTSAWIGDETAEREIGRAELLAIVHGDGVGTHTTYVVRGADQERFTR